MKYGDLIDRQAAIDIFDDYNVSVENGELEAYSRDRKRLCDLPSAQPEIKPIEYRDCANAMLRMWMDNVITDWEYNLIMDKLNAHWGMKIGDE